LTGDVFASAILSFMVKLAIPAVFPIVLSVVLCQAQASPNTSKSDASGPQPQIIKVFSKAAALLHQKTSVPLRLPTHVSGLDGEGEVYAIVKSANETGYVVILGATPDCEGQHVCSNGTLIGTSRPLSQVDEYAINDRRGILVRLQHGLKGYFYESVCGAYCSDSLIVWTEGNNHYIIGLKAQRKSDMIGAANSAIQGGSERWK
jgi:hypothetical protein